MIIDNEEYITYVCRSLDFKKPGEVKSPLDMYYTYEKEEKEKLLDFCIRIGFEKYIYEMLLVDFLINNRDRHGANIEVLKDSKTKEIRLAPLFDHGLSLIFSSYDIKSMTNVDVMADTRVQCCVGSNSTFENLNIIPIGKEPKVNKLKEADRGFILHQLDQIMPTEWLDKVWEMIWRRWQYYEDFCNNRRTR